MKQQDYYYELQWQDEVRYRFQTIAAPSLPEAQIKARYEVGRPLLWKHHRGTCWVGLNPTTDAEICRLTLITPE